MDGTLLQYFSKELKLIIRNLGDNVTEIRLRKNAPLTVMIGGKSFFATSGGCLTSAFAKGCYVVSDETLRCTFEAVCRYSLHSYQENICSGYITLEGGHRVGICGTAVVKDKTVVNVKDISGLNFRIAASVKGCAENLYRRFYSTRPCNLLIAGAPARGKTTLLRDLCRCIGNSLKVSLIDSRSELAAVYEGVPQNDIGINTDVFDGYPKSVGIETAVRVMSPDVIVCDEIGSEDVQAVEYAMNCGVRICTTVHGGCAEDIKRKLPFYKSFDIVVILSSTGREGEIREIIEMSGGNENIIDACAYNADNINRSICFASAEKTMGVS